MTTPVTDAKSAAAKSSVLASLLVTTLKFAAAFASGSLAVLSEALHNLIDLGATLLTWFAVRIADEPADEEHHYGHAKIEYVAALVEAGLLILTSVFVAYEALRNLWNGESPLVPPWWVFVLFGIGIAVDIWRARALRIVALAEKSAALGADATHFESDIYASLAVLAGLAATAMGLPAADSIAALTVSGFIFWLGYGLGSSTISSLLDRAPDGATEKLRQIVDLSPGLIGIKDLRLRQVGTTTFIALNAFVPRSLSMAELAALSADVKRRVLVAFPASDLQLALEPIALENETVHQKILAVAASHGFAIHHLVVQQLGNEQAVSFDVELPPEMSLGTAHENATRLENEIRGMLGGQLEVESHIEPKPTELLHSVMASKQALAQTTAALLKAAHAERTISDIHNIRLRKIGRDHYLHYHCRFSPELSLETCHEALDRVEAKLIASLPKLKRVVAHPEPHRKTAGT